MKQQTKATLFALLAAALYAVNLPVSKLFLSHIPATMMAGFLYLGAGTGIFLLSKFQKATGNELHELPLTKKELPYTIAMVVLDIAAPICLMIGLTKTTAANASLLNNFEITATAIIALIVFKETISIRLWGAIVCVTIACTILSFEDISSLSLSYGSLFVLLASVCWGFENNCTRMLSSKNPMQVVTIKGIFSGLGSLVVALVTGEHYFNLFYILLTMLLGFVSYGLSIFFYIYAQRDLGAAKTSAYYAISPFIGVIFSVILFWQIPSGIFLLALCIMLLGTYLASENNT